MSEAKNQATARLRFKARINPRATVELDQQSVVSFLPMEAIGDDGTLNLDGTRRIAEVSSGYTYFENGDVSIAKITPCFENGKGAVMDGLVGGVGYGTTELIVLRPEEGVSPRFLYYVTQADHFRSPGEAAMLGSGGQKRIPDLFVKDFETAWPESKVQTAIASYLDAETARIDGLIEEKTALVEKLTELRTSTIYDAVYVESPGWQRSRLKFVVDGIIDTEHKTCPYFDDGKYLVVRTTNIKSGKLTLDGAKFTNEEGYREWTQRAIPAEGDILLTREAPAGEACIVPADVPLCVGQRTVLLQVNREVAHPEFVLWSLYGGLSSQFIADLSRGSTVPHFNMGDIGNIPLCIGPLEEQVARADLLQKRLGEVDGVMAHVAQEIELLRELRFATITDAVLGRIDVREHMKN